MIIPGSANPLLLGGEGYQIGRSVRLRSSASAYFNRTFGAPTDNKKFTLSGWVKRGAVGSGYYPLFLAGTSGSAYAGIWFNGDTFVVFSYNGATVYNLTTNAVYRDPSAWYHIVVVFDTAQATASSRLLIYVNGVQVTSFAASTYPAQNLAGYFNSAIAHNIGNASIAGAGYFDGYLTEINFIDGQALTPSSFGEYNAITGVWQPKKYGGTYGTNGFYLNFSDPSAATAAAIGKDYSGNGNNWTPNNISVTAGVTYDSMLDVPTPYADGGNGRGNYAVLNPLNLQGSITSGTISGGNLNSTPSPSAAGYTNYLSSIAAPSTGYWYAEFAVSGTYQGANNNFVGIQLASSKSTTSLGAEATTYSYADGDRTTGSFRNNNTTSQSVAGFQTGDVLMVAIGNGGVWFGKNGTWLGTGSPNPATATSPAYSGLSGDYYFAYSAYGTSGVTYGYSSFANFGQRPFAYTPPTGFKALNTQNLPDSTINNGAKYMAASLYTGTGASQSIVNSGNNTGAVSFQPDFLWVKSRNNVSNNGLFDSVRGGSKLLISELTDAEYTGTYLSSFNSNGFTIGATASSTLNASSYTYVGWQWKANGSAVSNTAGSITSQVNANPTAGFSVVTYTGTGANATVGHGLGVAPKLIIGKKRNSTGSWQTYVSAIPNMATGYIVLNNSGAWTSNSTIWNGTAPTSTVFSLGTDTDINQNGATNVAYCFSEVAGYSKFGSYTGNGSADGPFVYCGFRPRYVMIKRTDSTGDWEIWDTSRDPYNASGHELLANSSQAEAVYNAIDILSNGLKLRDGSLAWNTSGGTYIFCAFAENPFKNSLAR